MSLLANGFQLCVCQGGGVSTPRVRGGPEGLPSEPGPPAAVGSGAHPDSRLEVLGGTALNLIRIFPPSEIRQNNKANNKQATFSPKQERETCKLEITEQVLPGQGLGGGLRHE